VRYLTGESTPEEREDVDRWIAADPGHKDYADRLFRIWEESRRLGPPRPVNAGAAWQRFVQSGKIPVKAGEGPVRVRVVKLFPWRAVAVAVVVLLAAGVGGWWGLTRRGDNGGAGLSITAGAAVRTDTLPDGSRVTLNKFSSLVLARDGRVARLTGEGFFQVVHEASRPFTVEVGGVTIRDVGTSFNVKAVNGRTEVVVEEGAIVVGDSVQSVRAGAGEKVVIGVHGGISKVTTGDKLYQYYRTRKFVCHKTPLPELVAALNEAYGVKIVIRGDAVRDLLLTTTFTNHDDLNSILGVITRTFGLVTEKNGDMIIMKQPDD